MSIVQKTVKYEVLICDRCGADLTDYECSTDFNLHVRGTAVCTTVDLCFDCQNKIAKEIASHPKESLDES